MYVTGYAPFGDRGILIRVETDLRRGIPGIDISGLADGAVKEARERVQAAFRNSGLAFPMERILINLAPAGVKKEGAALDLPIALSVMAAAGLVPGLGALPEQVMVLGELELSGRVRPVRGVLAAAAAGIAEGIRFFIVPKENEEEAALLLDRNRADNAAADGISYAAVSSLEEAAHVLVLLTKEGSFPALFSASLPFPAHSAGPRDGEGRVRDAVFDCGDFSEVRGQGRCKRALEIAAAGGHNVLVFGAPGAGKTMLCRRLPSIMAPLRSGEALEVTRIHSLAGLPPTRYRQGEGERGFSFITRPPFRAPHHSASAEGILGGGRTVRPGEISLAHFGVLFLDEAPEFKTNVLQALREPLEERYLTIARVEGSVKLPADFQLVMAANACPCGKLGSGRSDGSGRSGGSGTSGGSGKTDESGKSGELADTAEHTLSGSCFCSPEEIYRYWKRFGGALLDRIDIRVPVNGSGEALYEHNGGNHTETSAVIRRRVTRAVELQRRRFTDNGVRRNARMGAAHIELYCPLSGAAERAFRRAAERLAFSGRAYHSVLKTARTIADLDEKEIIETEHILEAVQHRRLGDDPYDVLLAACKS